MEKTRIEDLDFLTSRQIEIVVAVANDLTNKEIAHSLKITKKTVEYHRTAIYKKLGVRGIAGITRYAIREGFILA